MILLLFGNPLSSPPAPIAPVTRTKYLILDDAGIQNLLRDFLASSRVQNVLCRDAFPHLENISLPTISLDHHRTIDAPFALEKKKKSKRVYRCWIAAPTKGILNDLENIIEQLPRYQVETDDGRVNVITNITRLNEYRQSFNAFPTHKLYYSVLFNGEDVYTFLPNNSSFNSNTMS